MTSISSEFFVDSVYNPLPKKEKKSPWKGLSFSVMIHCAILAMIVFTAVKKTPEQSSETIKATLVYPKKIQPLEPVKPTIVEQPKIEDPTPLVVEERHQAEDDSPTKNEQKQERDAEMSRNDTPERTEAPLKTPDNSLKDTPLNANKRSVTEATRNFFSVQRQNQLLQEGQRAASTYSQQRMSPTIVDPRKGIKFDAVEEILKPKNVNCDNKAAKFLSVMAGLTGGNIQCSKRNNITPFIENRINKKQEHQ